MTKPYKWNADEDTQDEASRRIYEIAEEAGLEVVIICNGDFQDIVERMTKMDKQKLETLALTTRDCANFKEMLRDFICHDWSAAARECWYQLTEDKEANE